MTIVPFPIKDKSQMSAGDSGLFVQCEKGLKHKNTKLCHIKPTRKAHLKANLLVENQQPNNAYAHICVLHVCHIDISTICVTSRSFYMFVDTLSCPWVEGMVVELYVGDKAAKPVTTVHDCVPTSVSAEPLDIFKATCFALI